MTRGTACYVSAHGPDCEMTTIGVYAVSVSSHPGCDMRADHGGPRPGAGRKPRAGGPARNVTVRLSEADEAELTAGLRDGEALSDLLRDGALALVRGRR